MTCVRQDIDYSGLPEALRADAQEYIEHHRPPGDFLQAVICSDLMQAFRYANADNWTRIHEIVSWFCHEAPWVCWGSREAMHAWLAKAAIRPVGEVTA